MTEHNKTLVCYPRINDDYPFTLGYVVNGTAEAAYPSANYNTPEGGLYTIRDGIAYGSNSSTALISVSSVFVTTDGMSPIRKQEIYSARDENNMINNESDVIWVLDTGRPLVTVDGVTKLALASVGGPKLVGILAHNGSIRKSNNSSTPGAD